MLVGGPRAEALRVQNIRAERAGGTHRARADVCGETLWFESADAPLAAAPEVFGCALLPAALHRGRALELEGEVSPEWLAGAGRLAEVFREWWGYPRLAPRARTRAGAGRGRAAAAALCFSGGVDSFYSLLRSGREVDVLLTVQGYDMKLGDGARAAALETSLRAVAAETGARPVFVRTNLRELRAFARAPWERAHGGALAAAGHLLAGEAGRLLISSSRPYFKHEPWGSHWLTDALWSSDGLEVVHVGAELQRSAKLREIAREPLVRRHLRVCWENLSPEGNCSRCEKCLRTRLMLADCGELENFRVFEGVETLARRLDSLPFIRRRGRAFENLLERGRLEPEVAAAVRGLLERTRASRRSPSRIAGRALRRAFAWAQRRIG